MKDFQSEANGEAVLRRMRLNPAKRFPNQTDARFAGGAVLPAINPSFTLKPGGSIFTIGSCFARNVEEKLELHGIDVPCRGFSAPAHEAGGRPNRVLNQYNPGSMNQFLLAALADQPLGGMYDVGDGQVMDSLMSTGKSVSRERAIERRKEVVELYKTGIAKSEGIFITLGLIESWIDLKDEIYLNAAPPMSVLSAEPERFSFSRLSANQCARLVSEMISKLQEDIPRKIVLTVSPVPLQTTFTGHDCVVANQYSKAVLRVAAESLVESHQLVDYFPSYEIVVSSGFTSFQDDNVHVKNEVVEQVIGYMIENYVTK